MSITLATRRLCDHSRHLICEPYSIDGLHEMAAQLGIKRCWFHGGKLAHYDIPKRRVSEIMSRCEVVSSREITRIIRAAAPKQENQP